MVDPSLYIHKEISLAWIIFNRPEKRNSINLEMWQTLPKLVKEVAEDKDIRVLLIRGVGEEAFTSGADVSQFEKERFGADTNEYDQAISEALSALINLEKPVIAMIHGPCVGGECSLAMMCDLRIAADDASLSIPATRLGIAYSLERGAERLVSLVGVQLTLLRFPLLDEAITPKMPIILGLSIG